METTGSGSGLMMIVGVVFILIGLIFIPVAIKKVRTDQASRTWPQTDAVLERAEVVKTVIDRMHKDDAPTSRISYSAVRHYRYSVNGQSYLAIKGESADSAEHAAKLVAAYPTTETRAIYYDPQQPDSYRIELEHPYSGLLWLLPGLAFAGFGWLVIRAS